MALARRLARPSGSAPTSLELTTSNSSACVSLSIDMALERFDPLASLGPLGSWPKIVKHAFRIFPWPPNRILSRQDTHLPQALPFGTSSSSSSPPALTYALA